MTLILLLPCSTVTEIVLRMIEREKGSLSSCRINSGSLTASRTSAYFAACCGGSNGAKSKRLFDDRRQPDRRRVIEQTVQSAQQPVDRRVWARRRTVARFAGGGQSQPRGRFLRRPDADG